MIGRVASGTLYSWATSQSTRASGLSEPMVTVSYGPTVSSSKMVTSGAPASCESADALSAPPQPNPSPSSPPPQKRRGGGDKGTTTGAVSASRSSKNSGAATSMVAAGSGTGRTQTKSLGS